MLVRQLMSRPQPGQGGDGHSPVLVCEGPPASGKTELLYALAGLLEGRVPCAHLDLETVEATSGDEAVPKLLAALAFQLARRTGHYGALAFPRLVVGHLAMTLDLDWIDRGHARKQVDAALSTYRGVDRWTRTLGDVAAQVLARVAGLQPVPPTLLERGFAGAARVMNRWGPGRRVLLGPYQDWYGRQDRDINEPAIEALVGLNRWNVHKDNPDNRQRIAKLLLSAFLADLRGNFGVERGHSGGADPGRRGGAARADEWSFNCVVLLDNADCELGRAFLSQLVEVRRDHAAGGLGAPDPLTVVATSRGDLLADLDADPDRDRETSGDGGGDGWGGRRHGLARQRWWLRYALRPLTLDEINVMVAALALPSGNSQRLAIMIRDLTVGQPAATQLLLDVIADRHTGLAELDELLRSQRGGESVEERLYHRLLHGIPTESIEDLTTCAAARDRASGRLIAQSGLCADRTVADSVALAAGLWTHEANGRPTLLRRLLLRRLAGRPRNHRASWAAAHQWLHSDAAMRADHTDAYLYYALALDRWESIAEILTARLHTDDLGGWLSRVAALTWAPRRPASARGGSPSALAQELALPHERPDPVYSTVVNLLASLSVARDPLCGSSRGGLYWQIAHRYEEISHHTGTGSDELVALIHRYQVRARQWQQQPTPAQLSGDHTGAGRTTRRPG
jgi:hypothetical protein